MPRTVSDWLDYQSTLHPKAIELGLERVAGVWRSLGSPVPAARVITLAGTNGKGSTAAFLEGILKAAGYRTGCYTSPHLLRYNERIHIDAQPVDDAHLCDAFERVEQARGDIPLTYFEYGTLAALWCMANAGLDVAILEVGLGGRLDAVNIIDADVALISGIALDHTDWLGTSLEQIGMEKAGIARTGRPLVFAASDMPRTIADTAHQVGAVLYRLGRDYDYQAGDNGWQWRCGARVRSGLPVPGMRGDIQLRNAAGALTALALLPDRPVDQQAVRRGLLKARVRGRFEVQQRNCRWILDVAHNPQAARVLAAQLASLYVPGTRHVVTGMLGDKAVGEVLALLDPVADQWHLLDLSSEPRGAAVADLLQQLPADAGNSARCWGSVEQCLEWLRRNTAEQDQVLICGSFVTVGQAMTWMENSETSDRSKGL